VLDSALCSRYNKSNGSPIFNRAAYRFIVIRQLPWRMLINSPNQAKRCNMSANPGNSYTNIKKVLLAIDGSEHSLAAARLLTSLPGAVNCKVRAVAVLVPRQAHSHAKLAGVLEDVEGMLCRKEIPVQTELLTGYPAEQIVAYADGFQPDLILMGAKGLRATLGILLGGVAQQVVEYAHWPVMVVRAPFRGIRRVLLVTDGSPASERAATFVTDMTLPAGTELRLMHVLPPLPTPEIIARAWPLDLQVSGTLPIAEIEESFARQAEQEHEEGQRLLRDTTERFEALGLQTLPVLLRGDAASEILEYARDNEIDLIVAGSRGLGRVRGWLLGSVSRKLLHYANCSVLIVRDEENQEP
jgi:nucleotide-binding universal stress UspA family protein